MTKPVIFLASVTPTPHTPTAYAGDGVAAGAIVGAWMGYLPSIAAGLAIIWYLIQIWQSETVQRVVARVTKKPSVTVPIAEPTVVMVPTPDPQTPVVVVPVKQPEQK